VLAAAIGRAAVVRVLARIGARAFARDRSHRANASSGEARLIRRARGAASAAMCSRRAKVDADAVAPHTIVIAGYLRRSVGRSARGPDARHRIVLVAAARGDDNESREEEYDRRLHWHSTSVDAAPSRTWMPFEAAATMSGRPSPLTSAAVTALTAPASG